MSAPAHAKPGRLARFVNLFRVEDDPTQPRIVWVGMSGHQTPVLYDPRPGERTWKHVDQLAGNGAKEEQS